ncbi:MAG: hypothetical protein U5K27_20700 [Desulfotignum sp.]|nr:hypothetical protein [Desulfotignum sp.]
MKTFGILSLACLISLSLVLTGTARGEDTLKIKTSYKNYSVITYQGRDVLCEPYIVKKNDWLYKIFKQKGELSEQEFPFFISLFKKFNPHIQNVDVIATGTRILIPLKISDKQDYTVDKHGKVKIPVVEFHDTHRIYTSNRIRIPKPAGRDVSRRRRPAEPLPSGISSDQWKGLQAYARTINGKLFHQGTLYFPGRNGLKEVKLDLTTTPLIETHDPKTAILILSHQSYQHIDQAARQSILSYWGHAKIQPIKTLLHHPARMNPEPSAPDLHLSRKQIFQILEQSGFDYEPDEVIGFHVNRIPVSVRLDRVKIPKQPDLLLNFGTIFGQGIASIQQMEFKLLSVSSKQNWQQQVQHLLSALGYNVWHHPCFSYQGTVETLPGVYGEQSSNRLLVAGTPVTPIIQSFLEARRIKYVLLQP